MNNPQHHPDAFDSEEIASRSQGSFGKRIGTATQAKDPHGLSDGHSPAGAGAGRAAELPAYESGRNPQEQRDAWKEMGNMSESQQNLNTPTPGDLARRELLRLIRLNDRLEKKLDTPFAVDPDDIKEIARVAATVSTLGSCPEAIEPAVFLNEAARLQRVNGKLEPLLENSGDLVEALLDNAVVIAQLLDEAVFAEARMKRHRGELRNNDDRERKS